MVRRRYALLASAVALGAAAIGVPEMVLARRGHPVAAVARLRIATGPAGGVFREIGAALAKVLSARLPHTQISLIPTDASVQNLALLDSGDADLTFAAVDTIAAGLAVGRPGDITAVARLFDSWMQVLVPADSPIKSLAELNGRPVAAGAAASGTRFTTERLLTVAGVSPHLITASQDAGAAALADGSVAAMFTFTGVPTPAVSRLSQTARLRLLPLAPYLTDMTTRFGPVYEIATLASTTYPGIGGNATITTPNLLLVRPDIPDGVVQTVATGLFAELANIARDHPEAYEINARSAVGTAPVRLHPGAMHYYRTTKPYA
jgi:TRAP transporter TAXI family solute receptor